MRWWLGRAIWTIQRHDAGQRIYRLTVVWIWRLEVLALGQTQDLGNLIRTQSWGKVSLAAELQLEGVRQAHASGHLDFDSYCDNGIRERIDADDVGQFSTHANLIFGVRANTDTCATN